MLGERDATLDHVQPKAKGGLTVRENLVACCLGCNSHKAHHPWRQWFRGQEFWRESRERWIEQWIDS
jgi:5-methylcytosine-specific restriction endonuclease McrA